MLITVAVSIKYLQNGSLIPCRESPVKKGLLLKEKNMLPRGSIFFPFRVAPLRIENNFKGHLIEKPPK